MRNRGYFTKTVAVFILYIYIIILSTPAFSAQDNPPPQTAKFDDSGLNLLTRGEYKEELLVKEPILKKIDITRIGAAPYYETFEGLRLAKYFTIAQRVEIYQQARPIDAYIMDAKKVRWVNIDQPWGKAVQFRSQIVPIFTRSYGTEITMNLPKDREGQIRYVHDYRDIYQNQFPLYFTDAARRNVNYKHESWDQNEVLIMHAKKIPGIDWFYTSNFGYRYSTMSAKNDGSTFSYYENRHTYYTYFSLAPSDTLEFFGQLEYFKSKRPKSNFVYSPDHYFWATELRIKSDDLKTSYIPRFSYSYDKYYPTYNRYKKYEMQYRVGRDFTNKFNATSTLRYVLGIRNDVDNTAPLYAAPNPINETAVWMGNEIRFQYNIYDRLWLQGGIDYAAGMNMSHFDNWALLGGLEYYAPGLIRVDVGWTGNHYYNIEDYLSSVYFKFFLFM